MAKTGFDPASGEATSVRLQGRVKPRKMVHDENPEVRLSKDLLEDYGSGDRPGWERNALLDLEFRNGAQWTIAQEKDLAGRGQAPIVVNVVHASVEQAVAMLTANRPRFSATGREDSDVRTGKMFADLLAVSYDKSMGTVHVKRSVNDYYTMGMGVLQAFVDPNADFGNGLALFTAVDPLDVYIDPNSTHPLARDATHILLVQSKTREQWEQEFPQFGPQIRQAVPEFRRVQSSPTRFKGEGQVIRRDSRSSLNEEALEGINRYSRIKKRILKAIDHTRNEAEIVIEDDEQAAKFPSLPVILRTVGGREEWVTEPESVDKLLDLLEQTGGIYHMAMDPQTGQPIVAPGAIEPGDPTAIPGSEVILEKRAMSEVIAMKLVEVREIVIDRIKRVFSIGSELLFERVLPISRHPIIPIMAIHNRNPYPMSPVRIVRPIQEAINKVRSLQIAHMANATNVKVFVPRGSVDMKDLRARWGMAGAQAFEYNPELGVPIIAGPVQFPSELYNSELNLRKDIQELLGLYPFQQGDVANAPETKGGTIIMDEFGQRRMKSYREDIEMQLTELGNVLVEMMVATYTKHRVFRIIEPNNTPREVSINQPIYDSTGTVIKYRLNDLQVGEFDVVCVAGSMLPSNRWAQFEYYMMMYEKGLIDQVEVLKKTDVVDVEGVLNRFSELARMREAMAQMEQEIKNLQGDLQTANREAVQANKALEVEKTKAKLKIIEGAVQTGAEAFEARLNDKLSVIETQEKAKMKERNNA
jgi:hypothetical protein